MAYLYGPEVVAQPPVASLAADTLRDDGVQRADSPLPQAGTAVRGCLSDIQSRDQALDTLMVVSHWFRKTEPHSPLSYSIEQVVRRAQMPLPELL